MRVQFIFRTIAWSGLLISQLPLKFSQADRAVDNHFRSGPGILCYSAPEIDIIYRLNFEPVGVTQARVRFETLEGTTWVERGTSTFLEVNEGSLGEGYQIIFNAPEPQYPPFALVLHEGPGHSADLLIDDLMGTLAASPVFLGTEALSCLYNNIY